MGDATPNLCTNCASTTEEIPYPCGCVLVMCSRLRDQLKDALKRLNVYDDLAVILKYRKALDDPMEHCTSYRDATCGCE